MKPITTAVVGVGYLGRFHAEKYASLPDSRLLAVSDIRSDAAREIADRLNVEALTDYRALLGQVDAVSIVVPTPLHYEVARDFLTHGSHVLVEKPITATVAQASELIALAHQQERALQVGHLERFNAAVLDLDRLLTKPLFIESHRLAPFKPRGTDVSVVLDLMIHDIDIILDIVRSDVQHIDASGTAVISDAIDIANARLRFANDCVANVTASRVSMKTERKMRIFQHSAYLSIDFQDRLLTIHRKGVGEASPGVPKIDSEHRQYERDDALNSEITHFLHCIRTGAPPLVSGEDGRRALECAAAISELLTGED